MGGMGRLQVPPSAPPVPLSPRCRGRSVPSFLLLPLGSPHLRSPILGCSPLKVVPWSPSPQFPSFPVLVVPHTSALVSRSQSLLPNPRPRVPQFCVPNPCSLVPQFHCWPIVLSPSPCAPKPISRSLIPSPLPPIPCPQAPSPVPSPHSPVPIHAPMSPNPIPGPSSFAPLSPLPCLQTPSQTLHPVSPNPFLGPHPPFLCPHPHSPSPRCRCPQPRPQCCPRPSAHLVPCLSFPIPTPPFNPQPPNVTILALAVPAHRVDLILGTLLGWRTARWGQGQQEGG